MQHFPYAILYGTYFLASAKRAALYVGWSQEARNGMAPNPKLRITHSFFELKTPDFAWNLLYDFMRFYEIL